MILHPEVESTWSSFHVVKPFEEQQQGPGAQYTVGNLSESFWAQAGIEAGAFDIYMSIIPLICYVWAHFKYKLCGPLFVEEAKDH